MSKIFAWLSSAFVLLFFTSIASATTKSFTAASASLPSDVEVLATSNLKSVRSTETFKTVFPELMKLGGGVGAAVDTVKKECGIDPVKAFDDATIGLDKKDKGAVFFALSGVSEQKLLDCVAKVAKAENKSTVSTKKSGAITEVKNDKSGETVFYAWLPGDVLVVATEPDDKPLLERMLGGKGGLSKSPVAGRLSKMDPGAALSVAFAKQLPVEKMTVKGANVNVAASGGNVTATTVLEMASKKEAEQIVTIATMAAAIAKPKGAPKELERLLKSINASSSGADATITAQSTEKELAVVLGWALKEALRF